MKRSGKSMNSWRQVGSSLPEGAWSSRWATSAHSVSYLATMSRTRPTGSKARVGPQHQRLGVVLEHALDGIGIGVRMQEDAVLLGQLDHATHHGCIGVRPVGVEFADAGIGVGLET